MSVSLEEALEGAGYKLDNIEDCEWLLGAKDEYEDLYERAQDFHVLYEDYLDCKEASEEDGEHNFPSFNEWRNICKL